MPAGRGFRGGWAPPAAAPALPSWRQGRAQWEWVNLSATSMASTTPTVAPTGSAANRIEAWNGIAIIAALILLAGVGGHDDYWGNEGYRINLGADTPGAPEILNQPTPAAQYLTDTNYFADNRPTSSHTYYALFGDPTRNKVWRFGVGSGNGTGNHITPNVDAYDLAAQDWDAANTHTDVPEGVSNGLAMCQHPVTFDVYICGATKLWRWNIADATFTELATFAQNGTAAAARASLIDVTRNRLVILGDSYETPAGILILDLDDNTWTEANLTGDYAAEVCAQAGNAAHHDLGIDAYIVKTNTAGNRVVLVDPDTLATSLLTTTGGGSMPTTLNGVFGLFQPMPALEGYAIVPRGNSGVWFLCATAS